MDFLLNCRGSLNALERRKGRRKFVDDAAKTSSRMRIRPGSDDDDDDGWSVNTRAQLKTLGGKRRTSRFFFSYMRLLSRLMPFSSISMCTK